MIKSTFCSDLSVQMISLHIKKKGLMSDSKYFIWDNSADDTLMVVFLIFFSQETGFDTSCKLSPLQTFCMECQNLFSGENKKNISVCRLLKILFTVLRVKRCICPYVYQRGIKYYSNQIRQSGTATFLIRLRGYTG